MSASEPQLVRRDRGGQALDQVRSPLRALVGRHIQLNPAMHPHGTWPTVGAAIATGLLLGLTEDELRAAIGLAASMTTATTFATAYAGDTVRNVYAGVGCSHGMLAVELARAGITCSGNAIDEVFGRIVGSPAGATAPIATEGTFELDRGYVKPYACARHIHSALAALQDLLSTHRLDPSEVDSIDVATFDFAATMTVAVLRSPLAAKFSYRTCSLSSWSPEKPASRPTPKRWCMTLTFERWRPASGSPKTRHSPRGRRTSVRRG